MKILFHIHAALLLFAFVASPAAIFAAEDCSMLGGQCRAVCLTGERSEIGAFMDCAERQECCVADKRGQDITLCCIYSFDRNVFGPNNCGTPQKGVCPRGSGSPAGCEKLLHCK